MSEKKTPAPTLKERFGKLYKNYIRPFADQVVTLAVPVVVGAVLKSYKGQAPGADKWYGKLAWTVGTFAVSTYVSRKISQGFMENLDEQFAELESVVGQFEEAAEQAKMEIQEEKKARKESPDMDEFRKQIDGLLENLDEQVDEFESVVELLEEATMEIQEEKKFDSLINESISVDDYEWLSKISQETLDGISEDKNKDDSE